MSGAGGQGTGRHRAGFQRRLLPPLYLLGGRRVGAGSRDTTTPQTAAGAGEVEMGAVGASRRGHGGDGGDGRDGNAEVGQPARPPADLEGRREWARWRAGALLGRGSGGEGDGATAADVEEEGRRGEGVPRCKFLLFFSIFFSFFFGDAALVCLG